MQAGTLRNRITLLRKSEGAQNAYGEPAVTWASLGTVFVSNRMAFTSREQAALGQRWAEAQFVLQMRQLLGTELRARDAAIEGDWNGSDAPTIDILGVEPFYARGNGMQTGVNLVCREYVA